MSDIDNLIKLDTFKIENIREVIEKRFHEDLIYTNCGRILISLNPFKKLALYDKEHLEKYHDNIENENVQPHVYQLAENAYQDMLEGDKNQGILISGESGAGKTEISKHILKKIIYKRNPKNCNLEEKVNKTNHILESFGNAKTILNWNSSRFGKLTEIFFDEDGKVSRAIISEYMLEKSRLIKQNQNESNFHIFYAFLGEDFSRYKIEKEADYRILSYPHEHEQPTSYMNIINILEDLGFTKKNVEQIEKSLAAILHLTSIDFEDDNGKIHITTESAVANVADLMGLDFTEFMNVLLEKKLMAPDDIVSTIKSKKQAEEERDAFAKSLYSRLFAWIVAMLNSSLSSSNMEGIVNSISILDMSGFESLERNSFEQFLINFTNEKLQSYLEKQVFTMEKELYEEEGIQLLFNNDKYRGNEEILNMFEKTPSLLLLIDEQTHFPDSNSDTLCTKLNKTFEKSKYYEKKETTECFAIQHFAGKVTYEIDSFLIKNRDEICNDLIMCAKGSDDDFFSRLFRAQKDLTGSIGTDPTTLGGVKSRSQLHRAKEFGMLGGKPAQSLNISRQGEKRTKTVISFMKVSLFLLVQKLNASELHFIRCIRPNALKTNNVFERALVEKQLYYTGIADAAEIYKNGYPFRKTYSEFINTYTVLSKDCESTAEKEIVKEMLENAKIDEGEYCLGKNMIFTKDSVHFILRKEQREHAAKTQSKIQEYYDRNKETREIFDEEQAVDPSKTNYEMYNETTGVRNSISDLEKSFTDESDYTKFPFQIEKMKGSLRRRKSSDRYPDSFRHNRTISLLDIQGDFGLRKTSSTSGLSISNKSDDDEDYMDEENPEWDRFQMYQEDPKVQELQHAQFIVYIKLFLYLLFFLIILASSVIQKFTLYIMVELYKQEDKEENIGFTLLSIAVCIPYGIGFIFSLHRFAFTSEKSSSFTVIVMALLPETFHSIGLCVFLFHISGKLDVMAQIVLLNSIGVMPSLSKLLFTKGTSKVINLLTFIFHTGSLIVMLIFNDSLSLIENVVTFVCLVFVSINSWENFYDRCSFSKKLNKNLENITLKLYRKKGLANTFVYIWKTLLTLLIGYLIKFQGFSSNFQDLDQRKLLSISPKLAIILLTCCTAVGYYIAYLACRLRMQRFAFSLPLLLATPASLATYIFWKSQEENVKISALFPNKNIIIVMSCGGVLYITFQVIVSYIWHPKNCRLERHENLFQTPSYCSVFYEQSILLDRKHSDILYTEDDAIDVENQNSDRSEGSRRNIEKIYPRIYACATMWHENENEMMQILKSIFRMAIEQTLLTDVKMTSEDNSSADEEYYDFEAHIFFDDAMEVNEFGDVNVNKYVQTFVATIDKAASSVMKSQITVHAPCKIITPYGGQLIWKIQENVLLFVHLKDKTKIRKRKRWSQVMYMYYLLAHRLPAMADERVNLILSSRPLEYNLDKIREEEIMKMAKKTFILALDGDVDFQPDAVEKLLDLMKNDKKLGAACGRIHPIGKGPMIWFQIFEYAIGHWYQKATEHVLGCVLCSPGCFSLFRASALMDLNVMRKYTKLAVEPHHHLQYDQGEDRWLCTLLLQQGHKIGYSAASDAHTFAPETFNEFFNQRRRWMPSTIANILDLLGSYKLTVQKNDNVSIWFMLYQLFLMILTIIGPGTVMMMIAVSLDAVFAIGIPLSYLLVLIPNILFVIACFYLKTETQLVLASFQSAIYTFIMLAVMVGVIIQAAEQSIFVPGVIVILCMTVLVTLSSLLHLQEIYCLICGIVYFICIPLAYLILVIYSMSNMHIVSWGTRETKQKATTEEIKPKANENSLTSRVTKMLGISELSPMIKNMFYKEKKEDNEMITLLREMNENIKALSEKSSNEVSTTETAEKTSLTKSKSKSYRSMNKSKVRFFDEENGEENTLQKKNSSPYYWMKHSSLGNGLKAKLSKTESQFWKQLINKYLYPQEFTKEEEERGKENLRSFRTSCCYAMVLLNLMWIIINFMFQYQKSFKFTVQRNELTGDDFEVEPFSFLFLSLFALIFAIQFLGMILHRLETFFHIIARTEIILEQSNTQTFHQMSAVDQREIVRQMRYTIDNSVKEGTKSGFTRRVTERIRKQSITRGISLHETLRKRNLATVISSGNYKESVPSMAMSKKLALSYNSTNRDNEESHL